MKSYTILKSDKLSSTNDTAKKMLQNENPKEFTVISTVEQLIGRGQQKNSWHSKPGMNLTFSIILYPTGIDIGHQFYISKVVSIAIFDYLHSKQKGFKIKWPNDIIYKGQKICGILIENSIAGNTIKNTIVGIGLNMNQNSFPDELPNATSLFNITNEEYKLEEELTVLLDLIQLRYKKLLLTKSYKSIDNLYHKSLYKINESAKYKDINGLFEGKIIGTEQDGRLIIKTSSNELRTYRFKEVEYL